MRAPSRAGVGSDRLSGSHRGGAVARVAALLVAAALACTGAFAAPVARGAAPGDGAAGPRTRPGANDAEGLAGASDRFVAQNVQLKELLDALGGALRKPIVASAATQRRRVSGTFDLSKPAPLLRQLATRMALLTYDDGSAIYLYDASEVRNAVIRTRHASLGDVRRFLSASGLLDPRFRIRGDDAARIFYVSGVPMYVELIEAAARYLDAARAPTGSGLAMRVLPLHHAFVVDRDLDLRGTKFRVPGMVTMLQHLLGGSQTPVAGTVPRTAPLPSWGGTEAARLGERGVGALIAEDAGVAGRGVRTAAEHPPGNLLQGVAALAGEATQGGAPADAPSGDARRAERPPVPPGDPRDMTFTVPSDGGGVRLVAHQETNSIVMLGPAERLSEIESVVRRLDLPKRQIELSLWIIDVRKSLLDRLGVDWSGAARLGVTQLRFNDSTPLSSTLDGTTFLAQIQALARTDDATVVSRPILLTQENQPALFDKSETFYTRLQGERVAGLESITFGTTINVQSRLTPEADEIEMTVGVEDGGSMRNELAHGADASLPVVHRTHLSTVARVPRGKSLLIGGSTLSESVDQVAAIPGLASIPWLGRLFRSNAKTRNEVARLFLIEPRILDAHAAWADGQTFETGSTEHNARMRDTVRLLREFM